MVAKGPENTVDFAYLESFAAGDHTVIAEVLTLFRQQAAMWEEGLQAGNAGLPDLLHTIKGAARGVGANVLGDNCAVAEAEGAAKLPQVKAALQDALSEMAAYTASA